GDEKLYQRKNLFTTMALKSIADIRTLFHLKGFRQYSGEPVTQIEHALQCAFLAEKLGASAELVTACLLHDIGHRSNDMGATRTMRGKDDKHQYHAVSALKQLFPESVLQPIQLHVDAKRYLCAAQPHYRECLSQDSKRSLELQGGIYTPEQATAFIGQPY